MDGWTNRQMDRWMLQVVAMQTGLQGRAEHFNENAQPVPSPQHPRRSRWGLGQVGRGLRHWVGLSLIESLPKAKDF